MKAPALILTLLSASTLAGSAAITLNDTIVIDFGQSAYTTATSGWNNYSRGTGNMGSGNITMVSDLIRLSDSAATGVQLIKRESGNNVGVGGVDNTGAGSVGTSESFTVSGPIPVSASRDVLYVTSNLATLALTNLNPSLTYRLSILAANPNDRNPINYVVNGSTQSIDPNVAPFITTWNNVTVNGSNEIVISFSGTLDSSTNSAHINAIELTAIPEPGVAATAMIGAALLLLIRQRG